MNLLHLLWLLSGLLLAAGEQKPAVNSATKDTALVGNATNVPLANATLGAKAQSGSPEAAGQHVQQKDAVVLPQEKDANKTATMENAGKNRKRTDTGLPAAPLPTSKPAVEQKVAKGAASSSSTTSTTTTTTTAKPAAGSAIVAEGQSMKDVSKTGNVTATSSATSSTTTTSTTTTTTTTSTTTPKPKKPTVVVSPDMHKEWDKNAELQQSQEKPGTKANPALPPVTPPEPEVQGLTGSNLADRGDNGYVVPIVTVLLTVPLAIGVVTIMYRRFRDMWSTRHYRRMDFLVDGMYND